MAIVFVDRDDEGGVLVHVLTRMQGMQISHFDEEAAGVAFAHRMLEGRGILVDTLDMGGHELAAARCRRTLMQLYHDSRCPERPCDRCESLYTGPVVYCSLECAIADA